MFALTLLLGSGLLFLVEPMAGKSLLPALGGAPATWSACLLLFQLLLLAGYACAHAAAALGPRRQLALQLALVALALAWLPRAAPDAAAVPPAGAGLGWLAAMLVASLGPPFFVLSAGGPALQRWFSRGPHPAAADPYFLYAASNAGSLLALVAYPTVVEPLLPLPAQYRLWRAGFVVYAAFVAACAALAWRYPGRSPDERGDAPATSLREAATWVALAAVPSSLLLGVTTYLSTDVAAVPLLWILPLALYLASLVVAYGGHGALAGRAAGRALPTLALLAAMLMVSGLAAPLGFVVVLHLALFAAASLACHGELARRRPPVSQLTRYYLWVALGGAAGGAFNALVAPRVFHSVLEYPIALVAACALRPLPRPGAAPSRLGWRELAWPAVVFALAVAAVRFANHGPQPPRVVAAAVAVPVLVASRLAGHPRQHALALGLLLLAGQLSNDGYGAVLQAVRTFHGVYRVQQDSAAGYRFLMSGTTLHGMQSLDPARAGDPLGYYHRGGPLGEAFRALPGAAGARVAVVGLGIGSLASYARPQQRFTFFEVDPAVERLARDGAFFGYLAACGSRCDVVIGDARRSLAGAAPRGFDLIVLDAFSSDAIPVHLITREAFLVYSSRLAEGGALLVHLSNRHLALEPVVGRAAQALGLAARVRHDPMLRPGQGGRLPSDWMAIAGSEPALGALATEALWRPPAVPTGTPLWTDDYTNLLGVLRFTRRR